MTQHRYAVDGWGVGEVWIDDRVLVLHELAGTVPGLDHDLAAPASQEADAFVSDLCRRFAAHLAGEPTRYDDVTLDETGLTGFQHDLLATLRRVPWGDVVSYGELAALAGRPRAARAAGTFCAESQHSLVVPCHRVVAGHGIGSYGSSGVGLKRRLLAVEGVTL